MSLLLAYSILALWPVSTADAAPAANTMTYFFWQVTLTSEAQLMAVVLLSGALGSCIHTIRSLYDFIGGRELVTSWLPMYYMRPLTGAILALVFYLVMRGGFFSTNASVQNTSAFGFAGLSALVGLFTEQAVAKLKDTAEVLFKAPDSKSDPLKAVAKPPAGKPDANQDAGKPAPKQ